MKNEKCCVLCWCILSFLKGTYPRPPRPIDFTSKPKPDDSRSSSSSHFNRILCNLQPHSRSTLPLFNFITMISVLSAFSLLCLLRCVLSYPSGIQYETVPLNSATYKGCKACYSRHYKYPTNSSDVEKCEGPYLFVGAGMFVRGKLSIILGAFELAEVVKKVTVRNTPRLSNGVYWYYTPGVSFGFLNNTDLMQSDGDIGTSDPKSRLSWLLDSNLGGYRAGTIINPIAVIDPPLYHPYFKVLLNCPFPSTPSPSASPSFGNTSCPSVSPLIVKPSRRPKSKKPTKAPKPSRCKRPSRAPTACEAVGEV